MTMQLRPQQLSDLLAQTIKARLPVLVTGAPGTGKSDVVSQAARDAGADLIISHPVVADPTDAKGLPWPSKDGDHATFLPFGELAQAIKATKPTVWFLDDLGQASPAVQASFMQLLLARRINGHALSDKVTFVAATNRRSDRAGVSGILEPVKSRFATIVELQPSLDDWCNWALNASMPAEVIAFLRLRSELLHNFKASAEMENSPCPRTWAHVGKLVALGLPSELEFAAYTGAVGEGAAAEFTGFLRIFRDMPNPDGVLLDPMKAEIPKTPSALYAISAALAQRANPNNFERVATYATRLYDAGHGEFGVLTIRDSYRRDAQICNTPAFIKLASSKLGALIAG